LRADIGVIGAGKWGSALHFALCEKNSIKITSRKEKNIENFVSLDELLDCEYIVFALPAQTAREWLEKNFVFKGQKFLIASKGIEVATGDFLNEIFKRYIPEKNLCFLSGPSFASEVMQSLPTAVVINSTNEELSSKFASFFPSFMKTYTSTDVVGAEIAGAYKNVIAIASGICDGLKLGNNARASLISRGLVEMMRFGQFWGAKSETFVGLSGAGDLFLTATSELSRNYRVGLGLSKGKRLENILEDLGEVAEGVYTTEAIYLLSLEHSIYTPIVAEVKHMLDGKKPQQSLKDLLGN
jgi:glycerol-3-phosphate dehydrogenase (NAD(P)+)